MSKIQPYDYEELNGTREHPLRISGILTTNKNAAQKQQVTQEVASFMRDIQKQHEVLEALMRAFDDFIKRKVLEQYEEIFGSMPQPSEEEKKSPYSVALPNKHSLSLWLIQTATESLLC